MAEQERRGYEGFGGRVGEFASGSEPWWRPRPEARADAPNVVIVLVDDLGFSDLGPFGSEIPTPHIDRIAGDGWVFTNYRTAPMCSPARAALMTGLNPHRAGFGYVAHTDPGYPGFTCELPEDAPTLAESLRAGGYATFMVGKWHLTPESRLHDAADRASWPLQRGFDRYFGSMDGFTSLHHPHRLVRDNSVVDVPEFPEGYFLTDELTDSALAMIDELRVNDATKPFFLYFAHTSVHGPIQAKADDIARHRGRYAAGWNALREARFARQRELGIMPDRAELPSGAQADDDRIPSWESLSSDERELFARHMEVYAAAVDEVDQSLGRLVARLEELGELENTVIVLASDNGGTAEGGPSGTRSYFAQFGHAAALPADWVRDVPRDPAEIGGPKLFSQYPAGWARVSNTPFRSFKSSTYEGGVHAPLIISWPASRIGEPGLRDQFVFVSDLAPTILDLVGVPSLGSRHGRPAMQPDGRSLADVLGAPGAEGRDTQYFECVGRRAVVDGDWKALSNVPPTPTEGAAGGSWELYRISEDPTETRDLAAAEPERVAELAELWREEAWRNTVFPLDDDGSLHTNRPASEAPLSDPVALAPFRPPLERFRAAKLTVLRSFTVDASLDLGPDGRAAGVVVAHGDQGGGYLLAIEDGAPLLAYNAYGDMHRARGPVLGPGAHELLLRVDELDGMRWRLRLEVDGTTAAEIPGVPMLLGMAPFTGISVGYDYGGPVDWELHERHGGFRFAGGEIRRLRYVPGARSQHDRTVLREIGAAVAAIAD
ncbi:arylsulfatase [Leucobacter sp. OLJS4]|uniref:arylsulfatase n=1 Tax=unclassified Leucobacter TaxID=2621730 RepID=UPI000C1993D8|nr:MULTISPECIES: arylsulfatase [unclassified Leucobacter]PII83781.1 arylsulfatase [Leucobacter sp. OLCALW19]PII89314.1 arylsulfatase [Leucobacter sp. OLTLW20]PII90689.1 arylsulfatase [Leucobacter sp. OLAS13]PII99596.1 arylsulfatase [Leucobacter sp. OLDS2]PIJ01747.1 arylsulfatase [Leucobacter sp. OLCS4]